MNDIFLSHDTPSVHAYQLWAAAANGNAAELERLFPKVNPKFEADRPWRLAIENGHIGCVKSLIRIGMPTEYNYALKVAARVGNLECVKLLIPLCHLNSEDFMTLSEAATHGHAHCVQELIAVCDPKSENSFALRGAARHGHVECVKVLIPVSNPVDFDDALIAAASKGHINCVRELIGVSEHACTEALRAAMFYDRTECVDFLLDYGDAEFALESLPGGYRNLWPHVVEYIQAQKQKQTLERELSPLSQTQQGLSSKYTNGYNTLRTKNDTPVNDEPSTANDHLQKKRKM